MNKSLPLLLLPLSAPIASQLELRLPATSPNFLLKPCATIIARVVAFIEISLILWVSLMLYRQEISLTAFVIFAIAEVLIARLIPLELALAAQITRLAHSGSTPVLDVQFGKDETKVLLHAKWQGIYSLGRLCWFRLSFPKAGVEKSCFSNTQGLSVFVWCTSSSVGAVDLRAAWFRRWHTLERLGVERASQAHAPSTGLFDV